MYNRVREPDTALGFYDDREESKTAIFWMHALKPNNENTTCETRN